MNLTRDGADEIRLAHRQSRQFRTRRAPVHPPSASHDFDELGRRRGFELGVIRPAACNDKRDPRDHKGSKDTGHAASFRFTHQMRTPRIVHDLGPTVYSIPAPSRGGEGDVVAVDPGKQFLIVRGKGSAAPNRPGAVIGRREDIADLPIDRPNAFVRVGDSQ